ncbi:MAG: peptidoglycan DD-metalloendopeptidase family protein [Clostridia bacterium]|nr:peptidoglycan DD-metalloendopeptidase family protein [Clostridia bacterium]
MRKILCVVLAFLISSFSMLTYVRAEEINDLQTKQEELKNQINEATENLEDVQEELSENLQQVQKLDERIANSQAELDELNTKIAKLQDSIDEVEEKLKIAEERYHRQKEILEVRLVAMYESSDTEYLDVILSSRSVSDFLSNYFLITELANYDTELLEDMKSQKDEIELAKKKLDTQKEQYATMKQNQTKTAKILENTKIVRENYIAKLTDKEKDVQTQIDEYNRQFEEVNKEILSLALDGIESQYIGGELAWPIPGYTRITSKYGMRTHPITGVYKLHTGVDVSAPMGANFVATNDGIVVKAGYNGAYGNMVIIDHGGGVSTLYAHGSEIMVQVGDTVKRGETVVLKVGSTGYSTGPHAHFEVRLNGVVTDPLPYITNGMVPTTQNQNTTSNQTENQTNHISNETQKENTTIEDTKN